MNSSKSKNLNFLMCILITILILLGICYVVFSEKQNGSKNQTNFAESTVKTTIALGESVFYEIENTLNNYILFDMSPNDTFEIAFYNGDKSDRIVVNSDIWAKTANADGSKTILHLIPEYIIKKGYEKISFTPIRGDGDYYVSNIQTLAVDNTKTYANVIDFEIKKYEIEIDDESYQKILDNREVALDLGVLHTTDDSLVPAKIKADGETFKTDIRLKGDWTDHLEGDQWSYRVDVKGDFCIYGMQKFSLQPVVTRNGIWESMIYEMYREQGGVALRYDFADVYVNDVYLGVFAIEEFMEKRVVENSLQREGVIIRVNENPMWTRWSYYSGIAMQDYTVFSEKKTTQSLNLNGYAQSAITMINKFKYEDEPLENVFDVDKYLKLYAILDLFTSSHGRPEHNMRHYYNPVTGLLEPVPFDEVMLSGLGWGLEEYFFIDHRMIPNYTIIIAEILENDENMELMLQYLAEFAADYPNFIKRHENTINNYITTIQRDDTSFIMDVWDVNERIKDIKLLENPITPKISTTYNSKTNSYELRIKNDNPLVIEISRILQNGENIIRYCTPNDRESKQNGVLLVKPRKTITLTIPVDKISNPNELSIIWQTNVSQVRNILVSMVEEGQNND